MDQISLVLAKFKLNLVVAKNKFKINTLSQKKEVEGHLFKNPTLLKLTGKNLTASTNPTTNFAALPTIFTARS